MNSILKRFAIMLMVVIAAMCMAALAACTPEDSEGGKKDPTYATDTFVVTVYYADGTLVDGTTGKLDSMPELDANVKVQFCVEGFGCSPDDFTVGADGKATIELSKVKDFATQCGTDEVVIQITSVSYLGYDQYEHYGPFKVTEFPLELAIHLVMPEETSEETPEETPEEAPEA